MSEFSPDLKEFVDSEVASGNFSDRKAVVEHALRLMQRDRKEAVRGIEAGLEEVAPGRVQQLDDAFDDLRSEFGISNDARVVVAATDREMTARAMLSQVVRSFASSLSSVVL